MTSPAFQFYPRDWLSSSKVCMMTLAQRGAYMQLLCHDWLNDGIPDDDEQLAALSGAGPEWGKGGYTLVKACLQKHPTKEGYLTSPRLQTEREKQAEWREKSAQGGRKSAAKRWNSKPSKQDKGGYKMVTKCLQPNGNQSVTLQSASSTKHEREYARASSYAEAPDLEEVLAHASTIGLPEWKARDWFDEMEGCGWLDYQHRHIASWRAVLHRVKVKWEADGRPSGPTPSRGQQKGGSRNLSVLDMRTVLQAKSQEADHLKNRYSSETATGTTWADQDKRQQWIKLRSEMKELNRKLSSLA